MAAGPVNQALLESNFQSPGQIYDDAKTEGAFNVVAQQVNENWFSQDALIQTVNGLIAGNTVVSQTMNLYRNTLINSNFDIWQRGTSFNLGVPIYTADRWQGYRVGTSSNVTVSRVTTTDITGTSFLARVGRPAANAVVSDVAIGQALPSVDSQKLRGQQLTLSFRARASTLTDFSAAGKVLTATVYYGTGTDEPVGAAATGQTTLATAGFTLTSTFQTCSLTTPVIPLVANQIFVRISYVPVGAAGAQDNFDVAQVQLGTGTSVLPYQPKDIDTEFVACQKYFCVLSGTSSVFGQAPAEATTSTRAIVPLPRTMRRVPNASTVSSAAASFWLSDGVTTHDLLTLVFNTPESSTDTAVMFCSVTGPLTQFRTYKLQADGGGVRLLAFDAEF